MGYKKLDHFEHWLTIKGKNNQIFWALVIFFLGLYLIQVICNHYFLRTYAFDYSIYNNAVWDYSNFRINDNTIFTPPLKNFLQDHISFTLMLIMPLFWILNPFFGTYTLLIIQVLFVVAGGIGTYKFVRLITKSNFISLLALLHYFMLHGHFAALAHDYHDVVLGASMVPWLIYFFAREKYLATVLVFIFVILSKENMPLWLTFIFVVLIFYRRKNRRAVYVGTTLLVLSVVYFIVAFGILIPYFEDPGRPHWAFYYHAFGDNPGEVFKYFVTHPFDSFLKLFYNHTGHPDGYYVKLEFYIYFLLFGGWLFFRRPILFLLILPVLAQKMLMDSPWRWGLSGYSSIEIVSVLTMAAFFVISRIRNEKTKQLIAVSVSGICIIATIHAFGNRHTQWHDSPKENVLSRNMYSGHIDVKPIYKGLKLIPDDAAVSSSNRLASHLAYRNKIYIFPEIRDAGYIVLLDDQRPYPISLETFYELRNEYTGSPNWTTIYDEGGLLILKKLDLH